MDRTQAFAEYGRILQDLEDSISGGFRRERDELQVMPPEIRPAETPTAPVEEHPQRPDVLPGRESRQDGQPPENAGPAVPADGRPAGPPVAPSDAAMPVHAADPESATELRGIAGEIRECRQCNLYLLRENTVPGVGHSGATLMVVTAPPADTATELSSPLPAYEQEYLEKWLGALGLEPERDVFITPAVKCRTPGNRPPQPEEAAACTTYLRRQYKAVAPRAVLALGSSGCGALTGNPGDFPSLVAKDWTWGAVPALVLWTPAEVLANPGRLRAPVWDALQRLKAAWNAVPGSQL